MINFYCYPKTRAVRTDWLLRELQLPVERVVIDIRDPESRKHPGFRKASPMGKVPAISDGDVHMADSAAIAIYLADRYPEAGLAPAIDHPDRGSYLYWCIYTPAVIEPAMMERFNDWEVNPGSSGWGNWDRMIDTLQRGLAEGPWILGESFSAADTLLGSSVAFCKAFGILPDSEILEAYLARCMERPAYQAALAQEQEPAAD